MLTVAKITQGAAGGYAEYLEGCTQATELGDYYLRDGERVEAPGRWAAGAGTFGLQDGTVVSGEQLRALMDVRRPDSGQALRRVGADGRAVAAIDATFAAPKSVSAVWAIADPGLRAQIEAAHEHAINQTLGYAVGQVAMVRQRVSSDAVIHTQAAQVIATSWRHTTARAVPGRLPDPQLHSHVILHGAVRRDGEVAAIDSRRWFVHRRELGAAYRTELAHQLTRLGFAINRGTGRGGRYFEIDGLPGELLERWSSREHQIRAAIQQRLKAKQARLTEQAARGGAEGQAAAQRLAALRTSGQLAAAENRLVTLATRARKDTRLTHADLDAHWRSTASRFDVDAGAVDRLRSDQRAVPARGWAGEDLMVRLTEFDATFPAHTARAVALEASAGLPIAHALAVLDQAARSGAILSLADGSHTTRLQRHVERQTVALAHQLADRQVPAIKDTTVARETQRLERRLVAEGAGLSEEQRDAIRVGCSERQLVVIEGQAGTGKSTVLTAIARAHHAHGQQIIVTSTGALAAERLARELSAAGVDAEAYSTARLHAAVNDGRVRLGPATTVIHDEAALASTREQYQLFTALAEHGGRLIEVGDPRQSQPVGAGGLWPQLEHAARATSAHVELTRNVRAHDPRDRRDQKHFRDGQAQQALAGYHARGRLVTAGEQRTAEDLALEAAHADRHAGKSTLVIAQTSNEHLDQLNARAQAIRIQDGQLSDRSIPVTGRPYALHAGDHVQIRRTLPQHAQAPLRNGTTGEVTHVDPGTQTLRLRTSDERHLTLDPSALARADVRLAYVQHPFPAQGQTTDTAHLIVAEHATQEGSYVALTRARERTHIYASPQHADPEAEPHDPRAELAQRMSRTEPEVPSIDLPLAHEDHITSEQHHTQQLTKAAAHDAAHTDPPAPEHVTAAIGPPPPDDEPRRLAWQHGAQAIEAYRARYAIDPDQPRPLGPQPPAGHFQQRHDRTAAERTIAQVRERLGLDHDRGTRDRRCAENEIDEPARRPVDGFEP